LVLSILQRYVAHGEVASNACWALVIMARPIGALEGSTFQHTQMHNTKNIEEIVEGGGIELVLQVLTLHVDSPLVMAKAFWSLVNMSLYDPFKDKIIGGGGIHKIIEAMRRFPDHIELQYVPCTPPHSTMTPSRRAVSLSHSDSTI
jgi:hypothetical protein